MPDDPSPTAWAERMVSELRSLCTAVGLGPSAISRVALRMTEFAGFAGAADRKAGRYAQARRVADRRLALADRIVQIYPGDSASYQMLSEAYLQVAKSAWRPSPDLATIERSLRQSLEAMLRASSLDPQDQGLQRLVQDRRERLAMFDRKPAPTALPVATSFAH